MSERRRITRTYASMPLFITCRRPGCERIREVATLEQQEAGGFCSPRCNALHHQHIKGWGQKGGIQSAAVRKAAMLARVEGLSALDAFELGYQRGLQAKTRRLHGGPDA